MEKKYPFIPYEFEEMSVDDTARRAAEYLKLMHRRRSIRHFTDREVPAGVIEDIIMTASTAPSGAHKQPWVFCAVSDPEIKKQMRIAAEEEEYESYHGRMTPEWLADLAPLGTDWHKEFIETVPWVIVVFKKTYDLVNGKKHKNYYVNESVGLATGLLISAIHNAGLVTLTHTPSPMNFLQKILNRPQNERPYLLLPVGYPVDGALVPDLHRKTPEDVIAYYTSDEK
jgi:iodotyrosine deiodinase